MVFFCLEWLTQYALSCDYLNYDNKKRVYKIILIDVADLFKLIMKSEGNVTLGYDGKDEHGEFNHL